MDELEYFDITGNAMNYPKQPWQDSDDVACFGIPNDEGMDIMLMYEAMAFVAANDISSMIALRIPKEDYDKLQEVGEGDYTFKIKDEYHVDYVGKNLL